MTFRSLAKRRRQTKLSEVVAVAEAVAVAGEGLRMQTNRLLRPVAGIQDLMTTSEGEGEEEDVLETKPETSK